VNTAQLSVRPKKFMKHNLLLLLFLFLITPTMSTGAETRTLVIDFSFNAPIDPAKQLLGYRLYQEGVKVCETTDPDASRMDCSLLTEDGTFNFTLSAYYSNATESPQSEPFPFTIDPVNAPSTGQESITFGAVAHKLAIDFSFSAPDNSTKQLLGYRLYKEGVQACETVEPNTSTMDCELLTEPGTFNFTLTAYYDGGIESPPSTPFPFTLSSTHGIDFQWEVTDSNQNKGGFRIYDNGVLIYETADSTARQLTYMTEFSSATHIFTIAALDATGKETLLTNALTYSEIIEPTAIISSSTAVGNAPLTVTFDGSASTTPNSPMVSYNWMFGDGSQATGEIVSHVFTTAGTYYTELTVTDSKGLTDKVSTPIIVAEPVATNEKPNAVISADLTQGGVPLTVAFDGSQSSDPDGSIASYSWDFGDGSTGSGAAIQHTYTISGIYTVSLKVTDDKGATATATTEINCNTQLPNIEVGEVTIDHEWVRVLFDKRFNVPVVIAGPPTTVNESDPVLVRVRNIDQEGFDIRLQEWDYQDGTHAPETFNYIVIEKGIYTLADGSKMEAGNFTGTSSFSRLSLQQFYDFTPVILTQVATDNETDAVTGRILNSNQYSFEYKLQEMEKTANAHIPENIGYIAWEPGKGEVSGLLYEIGMTARTVTQNWFNLTFETKFPEQPAFIAGMQTHVESDTAAVRSQKMSTAAIQIKIEEEQSKDKEVRHKEEAVGYFTIGVAAATTAQQ